MDRFGKNFHDVDPISSRPFSSGHPDGVWVMSIIYGLLIAIPVIVIAFSIFSGFILGGVSWVLVSRMAIVFVINSILFAPMVIFLFRRSIKAIYYLTFLLFLSFVGLIAVFVFQSDSIVIAAIPLVLQACACYYLWGLKKDLLIKPLQQNLWVISGSGKPPIV